MSGKLATAVVTTKNLLTSGWKPVTTAVRPVLISLCVTAGIGRGTLHAAGNEVAGFDKEESERFTNDDHVAVAWKWPGGGQGNWCGLMIIVDTDKEVRLRARGEVSLSSEMIRLRQFGEALFRQGFGPV
ncbi:hypothetical protein A3H16_02940 [Candidatus Kaiserbacteria bacterium RIFCSPLOWO2_12_FULL_53_8]|uniref:Uncharacterized protein n=1 Tax=Candidatus Kaiserbacteria bacterium RIFCSPLOWO2_12_FULL_53_8 TaxID=1798529 RepID=A0A1F6FYH2_9BACT|nr:MAG: hypothetical protein A3H16_02940 [Candidatus Kaiserbacteria bacterium RIFCSPLOWO2_12_FULL_53_8]